MKKIILYLHVHQPHRLREYSLFDVGYSDEYFYNNFENNRSNGTILNKVAEKSYLPMNHLLKKLLKYNNKFKINLSITGTFIEQCINHNNEILKSFEELLKNDKTEILAETYHHSLASIFSKNEFEKQVLLHKNLIKNLFNKTSKYFRNTELIFSDNIAQIVEEMGYRGIITEGHEKFLNWKSPNYLYRTNTKKGIELILKNYKLSDDISWRFSNKKWEEYPLTAEKFVHWLDNTPGELINLFMDYETFGEHQWADTGIFDFIESFVNKAIKEGYEFINFSDIPNSSLNIKDKVEIPFLISWADSERDTSAWTENSMQQDSLKKIYELENDVIRLNDIDIINQWRNLQTSDHFYYMCTKWFSDGDAHAYFSPYNSPYEAYNYFNNALIDLKQRIDKKKREMKELKQKSVSSLKIN